MYIMNFDHFMPIIHYHPPFSTTEVLHNKSLTLIDIFLLTELNYGCLNEHRSGVTGTWATYQCLCYWRTKEFTIAWNGV